MKPEFRPGGDIFCLPGEGRDAWLLCPVNCQAGVMGAGLARAFAKRWPALAKAHRVAVEVGELRPGCVKVVAVSRRSSVVLFPTKDRWSRPSELRWIHQGLIDLGKVLGLGHSPVAVGIPMLGCGLGGLDWRDVRPLVLDLALVLPHHRFVFYGPETDPPSYE